MAGPYGAQVLSDLGADVIKINALHDWYWHSNQIAMSCNRGKRSLAVNLKHAEAQEMTERLIESADVIIHNMRYPAAIKLGIDYESLKEKYPRLVYCHTRGFERGPRELLPGNDQTGACLAGVEWEDGGCGRGGDPLWSLTSMGDTGNGFLAAIAICQALYEREKTDGGSGWKPRSSTPNSSMHRTASADRTAAVSRVPSAMPCTLGSPQAFASTPPGTDGSACLWFAILTGMRSAAFYPGRDFQPGGQFSTEAARDEQDETISKQLEEFFAGKTTADAFSSLDAAGVPCEISSDRASIELWADEEALQNQWIAKYPHAMVEEVGQVGLAFQFSDTPARIQGPPMMVGEHTRELLAELGYKPPKSILFLNRARWAMSAYTRRSQKTVPLPQNLPGTQPSE